MTSPLTIYGVESSPFVRKTLVTLTEKGLLEGQHWQLQEVNVFDPPEWFLAMSPAKRIPVLETEQGTLADSSAICGYLEKAYPEPALYPEDSFLYGQTLWFEEYADTVLAAKIGFGLLRTLMFAPRMGQPPDLERASKALHEDLPPLFDYLESQLTSDYMVGDSFTMADVAVCAQLAGLIVTRVGLDGERWPTLKGYMDQVLARPSFAARLDAVATLMPEQPFDI